MLVPVGTILKPRGLKGELKVEITYNRPTLFNELTAVTINQKTYQVTRCSVQNGFGYLNLAGITNIDQAECFRNQLVMVEDTALCLTDDEILSTELIGYDVIHLGQKIGKVKAVENYGGGDFFEIAVTGSGFIQIPNEDDFIAETNVKTKTLTLTPNALQTEMV